MPDEQPPQKDAEVTQFADLRADRDEREWKVLREGLAVAVDALYEATRPGQDVRVVFVAMYGDPYVGDADRPEDGRSVPVEARFLSLAGAHPLTDAQRRYLALETVRAASEPLFHEMSLGLGLADVLQQLAEAGERGDAQAQARYELVVTALKGGGSGAAGDEPLPVDP